MASKDIEESQQQSQGITIGTQGNEDMPVVGATHGSHEPKNHPVDLHIPNQQNSSATNKQKAEENRSGEGK
ncbi:MAG TPA: hypothetical protein VM884_09625 [Flavisolibacter sp.]|jgi:hypothetical protein|nr:hypothetical protein [Flavisolibacter sp.]